MALSKIGASIVLEGEKEYRNALKEINSEQKVLKSEMQLSAAEYKNMQNSIEALESKYDILGRQIEKQKDKVAVYNDALDESKKIQNDAGLAVTKYEEELAEAQKELERMKNSSDTTAESLEEQKNKVADLQNALDQSNEEYVKATQNVGYWQTGLNNAQATLVNMERDLQQTGQYMEEAANASDHCAKSIDEMGKQIKDAENNTLTFGEVAKANLASDVVLKGLETMVSLVQKAGEGLLDLATSTAYYADNINTMSTVTGVATDTIQALYYSEELLDVSVNTVTSSMAKNVRSMSSAAQGTEDYVDAYERLGVEVTDVNGELRDSEDVFWETIDALGKMKNETEKDAIAMQLFGRSAQQLNPLIKAGSQGFQQMKQEATDLGYVLDNETLNALNETSDGLERLSKYGDTIKKEIGAAMADDVTEAIERIQDALEDNEDEIKEIIETTIPAIANGLVTVVENIDKVIPLMQGLVAGFITFKAAGLGVELVSAAMGVYQLATEGATVAQIALNAAGNANPYVLLASALVAVGTAMVGMAKNAALAEDGLTKMQNAYQESFEANQKQIQSRAESKEKLDAEVVSINKLSDELMTLNAKQTLSNDEQMKMRSIVQQLNSIMPELNLQLDEETGHLIGTNEAIKAQIENREQLLYLEAAEQDMADIISQKYEAEKQLAELEAQRTSQLADLEQIQVAMNEATEQGYIDSSRLIDVFGDGSLEVYSGDVAALSSAYEGYSETVGVLNGQIDEQTKLIGGLDAEYNSVTGIVEGYNQKIAENSNVINEATKQTITWKDKTIEANEDVVAQIDRLKEAYETAKSDAIDSLTKQVGLFEELSNKSDLTVKQMADNLNQQTEVMNTYAEDIDKARQLVEDGLMEQGLLGELEQMGISGAGYLHELVRAAEEDEPAFTAAMEAWTDKQEAFDNLATTMADFETNYSESMDNIIETTENMNEETSQKLSDGIGQYEEYGDSVVKALKDRVPQAKEGAKEMAAEAINSAKDTLGISNGESSEGSDIGKTYAESMANGIRNNKDLVLSAVDEVTSEANARAKESVNSINRTLGGMID